MRMTCVMVNASRQESLQSIPNYTLQSTHTAKTCQKEVKRVFVISNDTDVLVYSLAFHQRFTFCIRAGAETSQFTSLAIN